MGMSSTEYSSTFPTLNWFQEPPKNPNDSKEGPEEVIKPDQQPTPTNSANIARKQTRDLASSLYRQAGLMHAEQEPHMLTLLALNNTATRGMQDLSTSMFTHAEQTKAAQVSRAHKVTQLNEIDLALSAMNLAPFAGLMQPSATPTRLENRYTNLVAQTTRQHMVEAHAVATIVRGVGEGIDFVIEHAVNGVVTGTRAVCEFHPAINQECGHIARGASVVAQRVVNLWEGSAAEQGFQAAADFLNTQGEQISRDFTASLATRGLSDDEIKTYKHDLGDILGGAKTVGINLVAFGAISKTTQAVKTLKTTQTAAKTAATATSTEAAAVTRSINQVIEPTVNSKTILAANKARTDRYARRKYDAGIVTEGEILPTLPSRPLLSASVAELARDINDFYSKCLPITLKATKIPSESLFGKPGYYNTKLLSLTNRDHMLVFMRDKHRSNILYERGITPFMTYQKHVSSEQRLAIKIEKAVELAKQDGVKNLSIIYAAKDHSVASTVIKKEYEILSRGKFPKELPERPGDVVKYFDLLTIRVPD